MHLSILGFKLINVSKGVQGHSEYNFSRIIQLGYAVTTNRQCSIINVFGKFIVKISSILFMLPRVKCNVDMGLSEYFCLSSTNVRRCISNAVNFVPKVTENDIILHFVIFVINWYVVLEYEYLMKVLLCSFQRGKSYDTSVHAAYQVGYGYFHILWGGMENIHLKWQWTDWGVHFEWCCLVQQI